MRNSLIHATELGKDKELEATGIAKDGLGGWGE